MQPLSSPLAATLSPPYFAVIFSSVRSDDAAGYAAVATRMEELAMRQPGYLGIESCSGRDMGITVSYWRDEEAIAAWKRNSEHALARETGRSRWYEQFSVRVARVEREYSWKSTAK
jgi:heme-degrading monooxygenase HmoA